MALKANEIMTPDGTVARECPVLAGYYLDRAGSVWSVKRLGLRKVKTSSCHPQGYHVIHTTVAKRQVAIMVHRAMLLTFVGQPPEGKPFALHNNDDPADNRLENLRWGSAKDNSDDRFKNNPTVQVIYPDELCLRILSDLKEGMTQAQISRKYKVQDNFVSRLKNNKTRISLPRPM